MNKIRLISLYLIIVVLSLMIIVGCATVEKPDLQPFTDISFVEIQDENTRAYHIRYPNYTAVEFDLVAKIYKIEGIQNIYHQPYRCAITKSPAYKWDEIEGRIKGILLKFEAEIKEGNIGEKLDEQPEEKEGV